MTEQSVIYNLWSIVTKSRTESPEIRKRQILDAARGLLAQKGYQEIKLDDVAKKAKLAKGTLYLHFKDKEQIVRAVFEDLMDQQEVKLATIEKTSDLNQLKNVAMIKLQFFHENRDFFSEFMHLKDSLSAPNRDGVQKRFQKHMHLMTGMVEDVMKAGQLPESEPFIAAFFFMSLIRMFWIKDQIFSQKEIKKSSKIIQDEVEQLMSLFLHGVQGTKKGKKA